MTADAHVITYNPDRDQHGNVYMRCRCSCGNHDSIHMTRVEAGETGGKHMKTVEQLKALAEQASIR